VDENKEDTMKAITCDRCGERIERRARRRGWPIPLTPRGGDPTQDMEYVGPCCGGGYCRECGALLPGDVDTSLCRACRDE
jgi:hypothetical protein